MMVARPLSVPLVLLALQLASPTAGARVWAQKETLLEMRNVDRSGFHFKIAFGFGGGPDTAGIFHSMELGGTTSTGWTVAYLHTFIQNKGVGADNDGPDLFGGHMLLVKAPLGSPEIVAKLAVGLGGTHDQSDGIKANFGVGWLYGIDFHVPLTTGSGLTLGLDGLQSWDPETGHHFGVAGSTGYTWF